MGIKAFEQWVTSSQVAKRLDIKFLNDCTIGIEAIEFLRLLPQDVLLSALGGAPLALGSTIKRATTELQNAGLKLHFVFDGLDSGVDVDSLPKSARTAQLSGEAFNLYENAQLSDAYESFRRSSLPDIATVKDTLKTTLRESGIPFTVAPYSALAQLVYYERHPSQFIDAVLGSSEVFCFGIDKIITKLDPENSSFWWIDRRDCLTGLGDIPTHVFVDALMLAGSSLLEPFPPLQDPTLYRKSFSFRDVTDLLVNNGGSVARLCGQYPANPVINGVYLDQYKRAATRVKHHVIMTAEGDVEILDKTHAPDDAHDCIGLRLPEELYLYLSRGMLRPRVLNWLTSGNISITQPLAGGDGQAYQDLLKHKLDPLRRQALKLLTEPIHRYYQSRDMTTKLWFDLNYEGKFNMKEVPSARDALAKWNVKNDLIAGWSEYFTAGTLQFAVLTLENADLAARTITPKPKVGQEPLKHRNEVLANTVWRFLQLRGYVNENHALTDWGEVLKTALDASGSRKDQEEAVFIAVELLRLGLVTPDTMFLGYAGAPERGSDIDKRNCMLVSRLACLGKIHHEPKSWSGPLSRHLLAYQSLISNVHASLRDLIEMILAAMFLEGLVDRDRDDWIDISLGLPFSEEHSCALGVVTMHYLDELCAHPVPISSDDRVEARTKVKDKAQNSDINSSLDDAFKIWDALYKGVGAAGDKVKDRKMWDEVNIWLSDRSSRQLSDECPKFQCSRTHLYAPNLSPSVTQRSIGDLQQKYTALQTQKLTTVLAMARLSYFLLSALGVLGVNAASSVLDLIPDNFDKVVLESNKPALVEFFAPWCGHCKKLAPIFEELAQNFDFAKDQVSIAKVDADAEKDLGRRFGVQGFPTLKWFDGKSDKPEDYSGGRDLESLTDFIVQKTGIKVKTKKAAPSAVEMLNDKSFKAEIGGDKDVFVAFTAPWCGHCKSLAPIWETLAQDYAAEPNVLIAKIDAEAENAKATAQEQGVKSYPTIKFFPKGSTSPEPYEGSRTEEALLDFMNGKAGTYRVAGGKLNELGGTIPSLDSIVSRVTGGETIASLSEELKGAASGLKDKYAEYYVKVADKFGKNQGYVEKELARLQGLLMKGGLAPEKVDDLTSRSNILRRFKDGDSVQDISKDVKDEL